MNLLGHRTSERGVWRKQGHEQIELNRDVVKSTAQLSQHGKFGRFQRGDKNIEKDIKKEIDELDYNLIQKH